MHDLKEITADVHFKLFVAAELIYLLCVSITRLFHRTFGTDCLKDFIFSWPILTWNFKKPR